MVLFLALQNACMTNRYLPDYTEKGKTKGVWPECLAVAQVTSRQHFLQDLAQGHFRNSVCHECWIPLA